MQEYEELEDASLAHSVGLVATSAVDLVHDGDRADVGDGKDRGHLPVENCIVELCIDRERTLESALV